MAAVQVVEAAGTPTALGPYLPILLLFVLAAGFAGASALLAGPNMGPKRYNKAKFEGYECGIEPSPQPIIGGGRVPVAYYLTAMLFILFDIEVVFLYPIAVELRAYGGYALAETITFIVLLFVAFVYVWRRGALEWK